MGSAHIENYADLRRRDLRQFADMTDPTGRHLENEEAGLLVGAEHCPRQTQFVVERPGGRNHLAALAQQRCYQILGRGLAGRTGDTDQRQSTIGRCAISCQFVDHGPGQKAEGMQDRGSGPVGVVFEQHHCTGTVVRHRWNDDCRNSDRPRREHRHSARCHRRFRVIMTVDTRSG